MVSAAESKICPDCGADCAANAARCWMCHAELSRVEAVVKAEIVKPSGTSVSETFFAVATMLLVGTVILIGVGLAQEEFGLAVIYAIIAAPAVIATGVRLLIRKQKVGHITWAERFITLVISASVVVGLLILLIVACLAALFIYCFVEGPPSFH